MEPKFQIALFFKGMGGGWFFWKTITGRLRRRMKDKLKVVTFKETSSEGVKWV